jgi:hypothetical protein
MLVSLVFSCICSPSWKLQKVSFIGQIFHRKRIVWQEIDDKKIYHLVNWHTVCLPKDCGGLGVLDLTTMNKSLLCKWPWKLENTQGTWQTILSKKYFTNLVLAQARMGPVCSHFWQSLMSVNDIFQ